MHTVLQLTFETRIPHSLTTMILQLWLHLIQELSNNASHLPRPANHDMLGPNNDLGTKDAKGHKLGFPDGIEDD